MSSIDSQLSQAYELIEADRAAEAQIILEPLLDDYPDNADLWWLYAHSVEDEAEAQRALSNVLRINPDYDGAQLLLTQARDLKPPIAPLSDRLAEDDLFADDDDDDFLDLDDDFDDLDDDDMPVSTDETSTGGRRGLIGVILVAIFLIILILVVLVINPFSSDDDEPEVASNPTTTVQDISTPLPVEIDATEEVIGEDLSLDNDLTPEMDSTTEVISQASVADYIDVINGLSVLNVISDDTIVLDTQLGSTLLISICTSAGDALRADLTQGMTTVSEFTADIAEDAVGFRLIDCENDDTILNVIAAPLESVAAFSEGALDEAGFRGTWQPVG